MRHAIGRCLLLVALLLSHDAFAAKPLHVLFVGNSLTYYNDLPTTFSTLYRATEPGTKVETEMLAQGGGKLRERLKGGQLAALLTRQRFDVVVLQELGGWPDCPAEFPGCTDAPQALREAVNLVRANGARAVWFSTWQALPAAQQSLSRQSTTLARDIGVDIVDVGAAMQRVPNGRRLPLLRQDGHPSPIGTWLTAAALVQAISTQPLPAKTPPQSCGTAWQETNLKATAPASAQRRGKRECHAITNAQWRLLRAAALH
ncbi:SGNH/GDSL hydrolase family protein [Lysobacter tyrosinilyticus]